MKTTGDDGAAPRILVTGASSQVGGFLISRLAPAFTTAHIIALGRTASAASLADAGAGAAIEWRRLDLEKDLPDDLRGESLIHLAPLWLLSGMLAQFASCGVTRVVALGSTSVFTKGESADAGERATAEKLALAEAALADRCARHGMTWTLLRPTLIYGTGRDRNVGAIAGVIRRTGFFPVAGAACGLRSPVHADDVAQACVAALSSDAAKNRAYQLSGGDTLTYREMVARVFVALGKTPRVVQVPPWLMQTAASALNLAGVRGINAEMMCRMNRDQAFDHADATRDLAFAPRRFHPDKL